MTKLEKLFEQLHGPEQAYFRKIEEIVIKTKPKRILEIGSGWAISTIAFLRKSKATLITIDKQSLETLKLFEERVNLFNLWHRIEMKTGDSKDILPTINEQFDIIYIDGDHTYQGVKSDLELAWGKVKPGGLLLMDDVFHPLNWHDRKYLNEGIEGGEPEFGVLKALGEKIMASEKTAIIYGVTNGFVRINF